MFPNVDLLVFNRMLITLNITSSLRQTAPSRREGKHLIVPMTLIRGGTMLPGSDGKLLYPTKELRKTVKDRSWENIPLVHDHPRTVSGQPDSAKSPGVTDRIGLGVIKNVRMHNNNLVADGHFDLQKTAKIAPHVHKALLNREPLELSTGLYVKKQPSNGYDKDGYSYEAVATQHTSDHVAIFSPNTHRGACSLERGCGVGILNAGFNYDPAHPDMLDKLADKVSSGLGYPPIPRAAAPRIAKRKPKATPTSTPRLHPPDLLDRSADKVNRALPTSIRSALGYTAPQSATKITRIGPGTKGIATPAPPQMKAAAAPTWRPGMPHAWEQPTPAPAENTALSSRMAWWAYLSDLKDRGLYTPTLSDYQNVPSSFQQNCACGGSCSKCKNKLVTNPFASAKQMRYMYSQHPSIAKRWTAEAKSEGKPAIRKRTRTMKRGKKTHNGWKRDTVTGGLTGGLTGGIIGGIGGAIKGAATGPDPVAGAIGHGLYGAGRGAASGAVAGGAGGYVSGRLRSLGQRIRKKKYKNPPAIKHNGKLGAAIGGLAGAAIGYHYGLPVGAGPGLGAAAGGAAIGAAAGHYTGENLGRRRANRKARIKKYRPPAIETQNDATGWMAAGAGAAGAGIGGYLGGAKGAALGFAGGVGAVGAAKAAPLAYGIYKGQQLKRSMRKQAKKNRIPKVPKMTGNIDHILMCRNFNPNHDRTGRFSTGDGGIPTMPAGTELTKEKSSKFKFGRTPSMEQIATIIGALDKPGRAVRGVLAGKYREAGNLIPYSDRMGLTRKEDATSGRDLLEQYGFLGPNTPGLDVGDALGFAVEVATDPLTYISFGASKLVSKGVKGVAKGGREVRAGATAVKESIELSKKAVTKSGKLLNKLESTEKALDRAIDARKSFEATMKSGRRAKDKLQGLKMAEHDLATKLINLTEQLHNPQTEVNVTKDVFKKWSVLKDRVIREANTLKKIRFVARFIDHAQKGAIAAREAAAELKRDDATHNILNQAQYNRIVDLCY